MSLSSPSRQRFEMYDKEEAKKAKRLWESKMVDSLKDLSL